MMYNIFVSYKFIRIDTIIIDIDNQCSTIYYIHAKLKIV